MKVPTNAEILANIKKINEEMEAGRRELREKTFAELAPVVYRNVDLTKLPNLHAFEEAQKWRMGAKGLLLMGEAGRGKSYAMWTLLRRLYVEERRTLLVFSASEWTTTVSKMFGDPEHTEQWLRNLVRPDVLAIDDLFKGRLTEAQGFALYSVFEDRCSRGKPIIATLNADSRSIMSRMAEGGNADRAEPLLRRMSEFCKRIRF